MRFYNFRDGGLGLCIIDVFKIPSQQIFHACRCGKTDM